MVRSLPGWLFRVCLNGLNPNEEISNAQGGALLAVTEKPPVSFVNVYPITLAVNVSLMVTLALDIPLPSSILRTMPLIIKGVGVVTIVVLTVSCATTLPNKRIIAETVIITVKTLLLILNYCNSMEFITLLGIWVSTPFSSTTESIVIPCEVIEPFMSSTLFRLICRYVFLSVSIYPDLLLSSGLTISTLGTRCTTPILSKVNSFAESSAFSINPGSPVNFQGPSIEGISGVYHACHSLPLNVHLA